MFIKTFYRRSWRFTPYRHVSHLIDAIFNQFLKNTPLDGICLKFYKRRCTVTGGMYSVYMCVCCQWPQSSLPLHTNRLAAGQGRKLTCHLLLLQFKIFLISRWIFKEKIKWVVWTRARSLLEVARLDPFYSWFRFFVFNFNLIFNFQFSSWFCFLQWRAKILQIFSKEAFK